MSDNPIAAALAAADALPEDTAVKALADKLRLAQLTLETGRTEPFDPLAGYRRGAAGEEGYGLMHSIDMFPIQAALKDTTTLLEIGVVTSCLVAVLATRGVEIAY